MSKDKIYLAIPSTGDVNHALVKWLIMMSQKSWDSFELDTIDISCRKDLEANTNWIVRKFLDSDCNYIMFMDDDIIPDPYLLSRLYSYGKDVIAASILVYRDDYQGPMSCHTVEQKGRHVYIDTDPYYRDKDLVEADFVGFGCILVRRKVFEKLKPPYFKKRRNVMGDIVMGSDFVWSREVKKKGFKLWVDRTVQLGQFVEMDLARVAHNMFELQERIKRQYGEK